MPLPRTSRKLHLLASRVSLIYLAFGTVWLFATYAVFSRNDDYSKLNVAIQIGNLIFVAASAMLLFLLVRRALLKQARLEDSLRLNEERWKFALTGAGEGVWDWNLETDEVFRSGQWFKIFGYVDNEVGTTAADGRKLMHPDDAQRAIDEINAHLLGVTDTYASEYRLRCKDGSWKWVLSRGMIVSRTDGKPLRMIGTHTDISERKRYEEEIFRLAHYDKVTGLANRVLFQHRLQQDILITKRSGQSLALLYLDLDRFKEINDTLGHEMGDRLLESVAARLKGCVRSSDTVARLGGDEFTIILNHQKRLADVELVAQAVLDQLAQPFLLAGEEMYINASIGITIAPEDGFEAEALLRNADQAMYAAKSGGGNSFHFFTPSMQEASLKRKHLTADLRTAITQEQFELHYQPIVELASGNIVKGEALIRWNHPEKGLISPADFIPIAEEKGLIVEIGNQVFLKASEQVRQWREKIPDLQLSINKSPVQLKQSRNNRLDWLKHLEDIGLRGQGLAIEITEGVLLDASDNVVSLLQDFHEAGVQIAIDDFGTGYSSLSYIKKFHIHFIKIDKSFTAGLKPGSENLALCEAIIVMAHKLGMKVIAEGVETEEEHRLLRDAGCDFGQGYFYSRPVPAERFEVLLGLTDNPEPPSLVAPA
jgi:diguanylate cyclase (GGDEF)-like protein/PAS domain S-box-containing protein